MGLTLLIPILHYLLHLSFTRLSLLQAFTYTGILWGAHTLYLVFSQRISCVMMAEYREHDTEWCKSIWDLEFKALSSSPNSATAHFHVLGNHLPSSSLRIQDGCPSCFTDWVSMAN